MSSALIELVKLNSQNASQLAKKVLILTDKDWQIEVLKNPKAGR